MRSTAFGVLAGVCGSLILMEGLCRALPVSSSTRADYYIDRHILTYAPRLAWRYSTGWDLRNPQSLVTNDHGFVSDHQFTRDERAIALIGDSYVEAASLDAADRPAAQLERALGGRRAVYAMGSAGTSLLDYAERIRYAHEQLGVRDFVVLMERGDIAQALCGSGNVASQCLDPVTLETRTELTPPASALKQLLRGSAAAQYLVSQLKVAPTKLLGQLVTRTVPSNPQVADEVTRSTADAAHAIQAMPAVDAVAKAFFARAKQHAMGQLVIVVDADRPSLMRHMSANDPYRRRFIELARAEGATVIDAEPLFRQHFAQSTLSLDVGPYDGHLNPLGVRWIASAVAQVLDH